MRSWFGRHLTDFAAYCSYCDRHWVLYLWPASNQLTEFVCNQRLVAFPALNGLNSYEGIKESSSTVVKMWSFQIRDIDCLRYTPIKVGRSIYHQTFAVHIDTACSNELTVTSRVGVSSWLDYDTPMISCCNARNCFIPVWYTSVDFVQYCFATSGQVNDLLKWISTKEFVAQRFKIAENYNTLVP